MKLTDKITAAALGETYEGAKPSATEMKEVLRVAESVQRVLISENSVAPKAIDRKALFKKIERTERRRTVFAYVTLLIIALGLVHLAKDNIKSAIAERMNSGKAAIGGFNPEP